MKAVEIAKNIYWVGGIDWNLREFHGYSTERGSAYNAYLIIDEKITLIDTVKDCFVDEMLERIREIIDPSKIEIIISNHVEMDHSGGLPRLMEICPNATIFCSPKGEEGLRAHYEKDWNYKILKTGDTLNIGKRNFQFINTPMVHWPDNMVEYCEEEKILFSNDSFGQHFASDERFDDECSIEIIKEEAKKYYANIVLPYGTMVQKELKEVENLDIKIIAPSHGIVWRSQVSEIIDDYKKWSSNETTKKAVIIYDTMWHSTEKIASSIKQVFKSKKIKVELLDLKNIHISDIMTKSIDAKYICVGSPTLNNNILPTVAAFLTYFKGLAPNNRVGLAFGSYGWGGQSVGQIEDVLKACGFKMLNSIKAKYIPNEKKLSEITEQLMSKI